MVRPPPDGEIEAKPQPDEVVVFRDFFIAGLRFPLDPVVVEIFKLFDVYTHQMTQTSFIRLNLYMWLSKTYKLKRTATGFVCLFKIHFQPKTVFVKVNEDAEASEAEPQFAVYTFAFHTHIPSPVVGYRNRWGAWTMMWFYHKVPLDGYSRTHPDVDNTALDAYTLKSDSSTTWTSFPSRIPETVCTKNNAMATYGLRLRSTLHGWKDNFINFPTPLDSGP